VNVIRSISVGLVVATVAACAGNPKPKTFGTAPALTPAVEILGNDRLPLHLRVEMRITRGLAPSASRASVEPSSLRRPLMQLR
jgi:hypothetical protein